MKPHVQHHDESKDGLKKGVKGKRTSCSRSTRGKALLKNDGTNSVCGVDEELLPPGYNNVSARFGLRPTP
jgi:hypothetical protein